MTQTIKTQKISEKMNYPSEKASEPLLEVKNLRMYFNTFDGVIKAVDDVSFQLQKNEVLGIVGESGSGKSATSYSILKLFEDNGKIMGGEIKFKGQDLVALNETAMQKIRGEQISMVFQDSLTSLDPLKTLEQQIGEMFVMHRPQMSKAERRQRCVELLQAVGIPKPAERLKSYPFQLSGGMRQRVVIAIALSINPELLIADEPTTALDVTIQAQILKLMTELVRKQGTSLILITHDLAVVSETADRIAVMYCGKIVEQGSREQIIHSPRHPYTHGLLQCIPRLRSERERLPFIPGVVPSMLDLPSACYFAPRCPKASAVCEAKEPQYVECEPGHLVACNFPLRGDEDIF